MRIDEIRLLFDYNYWANGKILTAAATLESTQFTEPLVAAHPPIRDTLIHALDAEYGWRLLLQHGQSSPVLHPSDFPSVAALVTRWRDEEREMRAYLAALDDDAVSAVTTYASDSGEPRERSLWHALIHVVNHGTQHRSEAALMLTIVGSSPGELDVMVFLSESDRAG